MNASASAEPAEYVKTPREKAVQFDGRFVTDGEQVDYDVCIVGAGPAGITIATELIDSGARVCLLEGGGRNAERRTQRLSRGSSVGYSYYRLSGSHVRAFGGTSHHWFDEGWNARPLDAIDFEERPGVPYSGWPFDRAHLEPYYERAQSVSQLGPYVYHVDAWEDERAPRLPLAGERIRTTIFHQGSPTFEGYYDRLMKAPNVTLLLHSHAVDVCTDQEPQRVDRIVVRHLDGRTFTIRATVFVLACGGIENARLLLVSNRTHRSGIGNQHDLVRRFFMERLSTRTGYVVSPHPDLLRRVGLYDSRYVRGARVQATVGLDQALMREQGLLNCTFFLLPRPPSFQSEGVRSAATLIKGFGRQPFPDGALGHLRNVASNIDDLARVAIGRLGRSADASRGVLVVRAKAEQAPNPDSRITLDSSRDALGLPRIKLDWCISERSTADRSGSRRRSSTRSCAAPAWGSCT